MKRLYVALIIVLGLLLIAGLAIWQFTDLLDGSLGNGAKEQPAEEVEQTIIDALEKLDSSVCNGIEDEDDKNGCIEQTIVSTAMVEADSEVCQQLSDQTRITMCEDSVVMAQAVRARDASVCAQASSTSVTERCERMVVQLLELE